MSTVIVAGAGCSLGQAQSLRPVQARNHPPLDATFFRQATLLATHHPDVKRAVTRLRSLLNANPGEFTDPFEEPYPSLEQYFADVYYEVARERAKSAFTAFTALLQLYNAVLGVTTNWMATQRRLGIVDRIIRHEASRSKNLTVVTFNQDLLLENVAYRMTNDPNQWCLSSLYGDVKFSVLSASGGERFYAHSKECQHHPPFTLLKLHGSLNWGVRSRDADPTIAALFPNKDREILVHHLRRTLPDLQVQTSSAAGRNRWYFWPLIVPPIYEKQRILRNTVIRETWEKAREAIRAAERLILVGYSLPDADVASVQMMRRAFLANAPLEVIDCVNPDTALVGKLKSHLTCTVVRLYNAMTTYEKHRAA